MLQRYIAGHVHLSGAHPQGISKIGCSYASSFGLSRLADKDVCVISEDGAQTIRQV